MEYIPPVGGGADDPYVDADIPGGIPGSLVPAAAIEDPQREIVAIIEAAGLVPDGGDLTQLLQAIQSLIAVGNTLPIGSCLAWPTGTVPAGFLERNGAALSMTTYELLYDVLGTRYGKNAGVVCTFTAASDLANAVGHGLADDTVLELSNSGGALPTGLAAATKYFVVNAGADSFQISATSGGAPIDFTTDGTGTNKFHVQFKLPDDRGLFERWWDHGAGVDPDAATRTDRGDGTTGDNVGTYQADQYKSHTHTANSQLGPAYGQPSGSALIGAGSTGASGGTETRPKNRYKMPVIKAYFA